MMLITTQLYNQQNDTKNDDIKVLKSWICGLWLLQQKNYIIGKTIIHPII